MKKKLGKVLCGAVSTAALVGGATYIVKKILGQNDIIDNDESDDDFEDEFDDDFEKVFSDNNKDEREYVTINITDDSEKSESKKDEEKSPQQDKSEENGLKQDEPDKNDDVKDEPEDNIQSDDTGIAD